MNPQILLTLMWLLAVVFVTGATAFTTQGHSLDFDISVTPTSLLSHRPRIPRQIAKETGIVEARKKMRKQLKRLKGLGCKPQWTKVSVKEYIEVHNVIMDKDFLPDVVVVKRCIKSCSYCGNSLGFEVRECYPENERNKIVIITYTNAVQKYYRVPIPEHRSCRCK